MTRVALITGGIGGIGTAAAKHLTSLGITVACADFAQRSKLAEWQKEHGHYAIHVDVADPKSGEAMVKKVTEDVGPVDILINNAGITRDALLSEMDQEKWDSVIATNLTSIFSMTRLVIHGMMERSFGRIINVSSLIAQKGQARQTNYGASKAGMHGFTKSLAQEVGPYDITVNTISPGYIDTPLTRTMNPEALKEIIETTPLRRLGTPEDIANLIGFIAGDQSSFITGADLSINGGLYMQ